MATKKKSAKQDNIKVTSPDGGATRNISNPDLAARLKAYQNRTGEYSNKKGGAKFTQPVEGQAVSKYAPSRRTATTQMPRQQTAPRQPQQPQQPVNRPSMFTGPVQGPLPQAQQGFTRPQNAITQAPPAGSFGPQMPQAQPMNPQMMGPQGPPPGYVPPTRQGAPPQPQYNPLPQNMQQPYAPPRQMQQPMGQGRYMPPRPMSTMGDMGGIHPLSTNPWGRQW